MTAQRQVPALVLRLGFCVQILLLLTRVPWLGKGWGARLVRAFPGVPLLGQHTCILP